MVIIREAAGRLELQAPYHPLLPIRSKQLGGTWLGSQTGWAFPLNQEPALRALCLDIWAVDGSPDSLQDMVTLHILVDEQTPIRRVFEAYEAPVYLVGREIAASLRNRRAARPGRGVQFLAGKPRCFVMPSIWTTSIPNGCEFIMRDVPRPAVARFQAAVGAAGRVVVKSPE
jgi:hypothetical protein